MCLAMKMPERGADGALILPSATSAADLPSGTGAADDKATALPLDAREPDLTTESGASVADVADTPHTPHTPNTGSFRPHALVV
jgi:hypothetical protein